VVLVDLNTLTSSQNFDPQPTLLRSEKHLPTFPVS
jgi:hypothetical protein